MSHEETGHGKQGSGKRETTAMAASGEAAATAAAPGHSKDAFTSTEEGWREMMVSTISATGATIAVDGPYDDPLILLYGAASGLDNVQLAAITTYLLGLCRDQGVAIDAIGVAEAPAPAKSAAPISATDEAPSGKSRLGSRPNMWMKRVTGVDWSKPLNGYAIEGGFVNASSLARLDNGTLVLVGGRKMGDSWYVLAEVRHGEACRMPNGKPVDGLSPTAAAYRMNAYEMHEGSDKSHLLDGRVMGDADICAAYPKLASQMGKPLLAVFASLMEKGL